LVFRRQFGRRQRIRGGGQRRRDLHLTNRTRTGVKHRAFGQPSRLFMDCPLDELRDGTNFRSGRDGLDGGNECADNQFNKFAEPGNLAATSRQHLLPAQDALKWHDRCARFLQLRRLFNHIACAGSTRSPTPAGFHSGTGTASGVSRWPRQSCRASAGNSGKAHSSPA